MDDLAKSIVCQFPSSVVQTTQSSKGCCKGIFTVVFSSISKDRLSVETWFLRLRSTTRLRNLHPKSRAWDKVVTNPSRHPSHTLASRLVSFRLPTIVRRDLTLTHASKFFSHVNLAICPFTLLFLNSIPDPTPLNPVTQKGAYAFAIFLSSSVT
jgi:hypothetical protein